MPEINDDFVAGHKALREDLIEAMTLRPCHITGEHQYNHHDRFVCERQRSMAFLRVLELLEVKESDLPHRDHEDCELCRDYNGGWHDDNLLYHLHEGDEVYARRDGNTRFAWYVIDKVPSTCPSKNGIRVVAHNRGRGRVPMGRVMILVEVRRKWDA